MNEQQIIEALKAAYRKHHYDDPRIGWDELDDILCNAICNVIGDDEFCKWVGVVSKEIEEGE